MSILSKFYPDAYLDSTYVIDFETLYDEGYRGLIFDIDNTLVPHGAPADERAIALFERLKRLGFSSCLLSNNQKEEIQIVLKRYLERIVLFFEASGMIVGTHAA